MAEPCQRTGRGAVRIVTGGTSFKVPRLWQRIGMPSAYVI
jgi:hypothetical protein